MHGTVEKKKNQPKSRTQYIFEKKIIIQFLKERHCDYKTQDTSKMNLKWVCLISIGIISVYTQTRGISTMILCRITSRKLFGDRFDCLVDSFQFLKCIVKNGITICTIKSKTKVTQQFTTGILKYCMTKECFLVVSSHIIYNRCRRNIIRLLAIVVSLLNLTSRSLWSCCFKCTL